MAPEIITQVGYGKAVDFYALGILLFELTTGRCPFIDPNPKRILEMIVRQKILFPREYDPEAKSLIRHLTDHDLSKRYGNLFKGVKNIKEHKYFIDIDFEEIKEQSIDAPF